ncbi:MAG: metallophosphoesterase [Desulfobacterales bacterium]|jgi:UDP-2,3-diacylglucosamine pyrophosphatase LpxH
MNAIIASDLHIGSRYFQSQTFDGFLENLPDDHELILNGDIIDSPYAKMKPSHQRILDRLEQLSCRQKVVWIRGNHDNGYLPKNSGKIDFRRLYTIGNQLLITHGDDFDDVLPRSRLFMIVFKMMHELRVKMGARPVHVAEYAKNWEVLYRVLRKSVMINAVNFAIENGFKAVTCGHTHYAEDRIYCGVRYINTGAWTEFPAHYLQVRSDDMMLNRVENSSVVKGMQSPISNKVSTTIRFNKNHFGPHISP